MNAVPTEHEIRKMAERLGYTDANGDYPKHLRTRLAKAVVELRNEEAADTERAQAAAPPPAGTTAQQLAQLHSELSKEFGVEPAETLTLAIAPALVRRQGLHLKHEGTAQ